MKWWVYVLAFVVGFSLSILLVWLRDREIKAKVRKELMRVFCAGCKNLGYYNDGSAFCTKCISYACIENGFSMKEENK